MEDVSTNSVSDAPCRAAVVVRQPSDSTSSSLLVLVPPFFPSLAPPPLDSPPHFVAVFTCCHGEPPRMYYVENRVIGNGFASRILQQIALHNVNQVFTVQVFNRALSRSTVRVIIAENDSERLRGLLNAALPGGPIGDGWEDTEQWKVGSMKQELLSGQLSALPVKVPHLDSSAYAMQLFAYHLPDYVRPDSTDDSLSTSPAPLSGHFIGSYPKPLVYFQKREPELTLLDFLKPMFPSTNVPRALFPVIPIFVAHSAGRMGLFYLELSGNEEAIDRLRAIAEANQDDEITIKVFTQRWSQHTVEELMSANDVETLRSLLAAALPEGPANDGWGDRDAWTVGELTQELLRGTVAMLPIDNPLENPYDLYATEVFFVHLQDLVRNDNEAKIERAECLRDPSRQATKPTSSR